MSQFDAKAAEWESDPKRIAMAQKAAAAIAEAIPLTPEMTALEVGCGTGMVASLLAGQVAAITAVDTSEGMLNVLREKIARGQIANIAPVFADLSREKAVTGPFDLIYSIMTFHHIKDIPPLLAYFHDLLNPGGRILIVDLDAEDGSFHGPETHIEHTGFDRRALKDMLTAAGFIDAAGRTALTIPRETETGPREFPVFLMTAKK